MTRVHIELQRVQTWLFAVPRLRAMVGANTLLGETLRINLPKLARDQSSWRLAKGAGGGYPLAAAADPLRGHDDPAADGRDGILSRDGGHFEAVFDSGASEFGKAAAALLRRELPGLRFRISIDEVAQPAGSFGLSTELPVLAPCAWTGRGLGSGVIRQGDNPPVLVSLDVSRRHQAAKRAEDGGAEDLASLLVGKTNLMPLRQKAPVYTFQGLAGAGYLALIHADGNEVGKTAKGLRKGAEQAAFYHRNRVLLRRALKEAIDATCEKAEVAPLHLLMLGGDDLLAVSRAEAALPFVEALCEALDRPQRDDRSGFKLTLGIGVVFARPTIPIHRLHEVAERLAASAKRRFRGLGAADQRSVIDWAVYTTAWVDDPEEVRRRDWVRGTGDGLRVLSRRPVDVLGTGLDSLQGLLAAAGEIKDAPRSQLRYLVDQLPRGKALSDLAFDELSKDARRTLEKAGVGTVWNRAGHGPWQTSLLDLVEISEIGRLGRAGTNIDKPFIEEDEEAANAGT